MRLIYEAGAGGEEKSRDPQYLPGIDIHQLSVGTLLSQLDANGAEDFKIDPGHYSTAWQTLIQARKEFTEKAVRCCSKTYKKNARRSFRKSLQKTAP